VHRVILSWDVSRGRGDGHFLSSITSPSELIFHSLIDSPNEIIIWSQSLPLLFNRRINRLVTALHCHSSLLFLFSPRNRLWFCNCPSILFVLGLKVLPKNSGHAQPPSTRILPIRSCHGGRTIRTKPNANPLTITRIVSPHAVSAVVTIQSFQYARYLLLSIPDPGYL
jgi:hypothetical protein